MYMYVYTHIYIYIYIYIHIYIYIYDASAHESMCACVHTYMMHTYIHTSYEDLKQACLYTMSYTYTLCSFSRACANT